MVASKKQIVILVTALLLIAAAGRSQDDEIGVINDVNANTVSDDLSGATITGSEQGWRALTAGDFERVNCDPETWQWTEGVLHCNGNPVGILRSKVSYSNFEMVVEWRHLEDAGNSGIFAWIPEESIAGLKRGQLPQGIEFQVLDLGYTKAYEESSGKKADWFTCHGDVFPTAGSTMKPFSPIAPDGQRSFPTKNLSKKFGEWNHYYIRCINGEARLWVNGAEVSGGTDCKPSSGYMALESEGAPIDFRNMRIRVLPD